MDELVPRVLSLGEVEKILQQLLREQVSIRDLPAILETLIDASAVNRNIVLLVEAVRQALGRALVQPLLQEDGKLKVLAVDPALEDEIHPRLRPASRPQSRAPGLQTNFLRRMLDGLRRVAGDQVRRRFARAALWQPCALSSAASAGAVRSAHRGDFAGGNSRGRAGAVDGSGAMKSECNGENRAPSLAQREDAARRRMERHQDAGHGMRSRRGRSERRTAVWNICRRCITSRGAFTIACRRKCCWKIWCTPEFWA